MSEILIESHIDTKTSDFIESVLNNLTDEDLESLIIDFSQNKTDLVDQEYNHFKNNGLMHNYSHDTNNQEYTYTQCANVDPRNLSLSNIRGSPSSTNSWEADAPEENYLDATVSYEMLEEYCNYDSDPCESPFSIKHNDIEAMMVAKKYCAIFGQPDAKFLNDNPSGSGIAYAGVTSKAEIYTISETTAKNTIVQTLDIDEPTLEELEDLVDNVARDLGISLTNSKNNGTNFKGASQRIDNPWNRKPIDERFRLCSVIKRILWDSFGFDGHTVDFIIKRHAYELAHSS